MKVKIYKGKEFVKGYEACDRHKDEAVHIANDELHIRWAVSRVKLSVAVCPGCRTEVDSLILKILGIDEKELKKVKANHALSPDSILHKLKERFPQGTQATKLAKELGCDPNDMRRQLKEMLKAKQIVRERNTWRAR